MTLEGCLSFCILGYSSLRWRSPERGGMPPLRTDLPPDHLGLFPAPTFTSCVTLDELLKLSGFLFSEMRIIIVLNS